MAVDLIVPVGGVIATGTAPVTFTSGDAPVQVDSDIVIEWDFDNDGDFDETIENLDGLVLAAETLTGRDFPSSLTGKAGPGQLKLTLLNTDDRFSFFNASSPLNAAPNSLRTGRKIRVRTATATDVDPVLLARDRFNRADAASLGSAETGQVWEEQTSPFTSLAIVSGAAVSTVDGGEATATVDVGVTDHYAQVMVAAFNDASNKAGLIVRWTNSSNYSYAYLYFDGLHVHDVDGGVDIELAHYEFVPWDGCIIGLGIESQTLTGHVNGVPVTADTLTGPINGTETGIFIETGGFVASPRLDDFHVWDQVATEIDGVLWTGDISEVLPAVAVGALKVAEVSGEGVLSKAALAEVASPRVVDKIQVQTTGARTGLLVGDVMARAGLLHPPAADRLDEGAVLTGPVGIDDGTAIEVARLFEDTERGFIFETPEGPIGFQDAAARATASSQAWFSDTPGTGQFPYSSISPYDQRRQLVNQVTAGVAPDAPGMITTTTDVGIDHVDVQLPATSRGDLLVVFIASSLNGAHDWNVPIWWAVERDVGTSLGMRVYSHFCDGTESGDTIRFYTDNGTEAGLWAALIYRIQGWFLSTTGIAIGEATPGETPSGLVHGWGREPTAFMLVRAGIGGSSATFTTPVTAPVGYHGLDGILTASGNFDTAILGHHKVDITESEEPVLITEALAGFTIEESVLFAVRGYNGPHTKATLENPRTTGGEGRFVTVNDVESQDEHNTIRSNATRPTLFATEADARAYADGVVAEFADDRPIISLSFWATSSAQLRDQAVARRVGDKITVTANGDTGLGIDGADFFIENIGHQWSNAAKLWQCTWQLSPA